MILNVCHNLRPSNCSHEHNSDFVTSITRQFNFRQVKILVPETSNPGDLRVEFESSLDEPLLDEDSHDKIITPAFSAYSKSGRMEVRCNNRS